MQSKGQDDKKGRETDHTLSRLASIGQISAGIAHEVRNPLTAVKGFLQLLQEESPHVYLDIAAQELERAISTLQNLLQVSKPDLDEEAYIPVNLCSEFEALLYLFQDQIYRVQVVKNFRDAEEVICGKRNQLKKAFFNLLKNAFEAIRGTGVITIEHYRTGDFIYVSIRDTGTGIPREKIQLLGTPFFTTKDEGTGMGLAQVYSTLYQHGATIDVKSEEGRGTTFTIKFPVQQDQDFKLVDLKLRYDPGQDIGKFFLANRERFDELLMERAANVFSHFQETKHVEISEFLSLVHQMTMGLLENRHHELKPHMRECGKNAAKQDFPSVLVMEFFQAYRKVYWDFLYNYFKYAGLDRDDFFRLERQTNSGIETIMIEYVTSFTEYKNHILHAQREMIDELTVPVIPLSASMAVLPVVGSFDTFRAKKLRERLLTQIPSMRIEKIIIDLSGVSFIDTAVVVHLFRITEGISLLGCKTVVTGIRPEIANTMIEMGVSLTGKIEIKSTLRQALEESGL